MFKGIYPQRNFPIHHNGFDHQALCQLLKKHKGGFILSYNDCSQVREWYKGYDVQKVQWQYTMGQGETRIGENRKNGNGSHIKASHELLITHIPCRGMSSAREVRAQGHADAKQQRLRHRYKLNGESQF